MLDRPGRDQGVPSSSAIIPAIDRTDGTRRTPRKWHRACPREGRHSTAIHPPVRDMNEESSGKTAIIDGSNVAHSTEGGSARLANIRLIMEKLQEEGFNPVVFADAALRHQIDDEESYEALVDDGTIRQSPAGTDADYFILSFAEELDAVVVSNDRFRDREAAFPNFGSRMIRYMIVSDEVVFEKRNHRR